MERHNHNLWWQIDFAITASERVSRKISDGQAEMFHQPNWSISGSALLEMGRDDEGETLTLPPNARGTYGKVARRAPMRIVDCNH